MKLFTEQLWFEVPGRRGFVNITETVAGLVRKSGVSEGLCLVNAMHITASVFINDNESGLLHDYDVWLDAPGELRLSVVASPTLDVTGGRGLRYAIAVDDAPPQVVDLWADAGPRGWDEAVANAVRVTISRHRVATAGRHRVRLWMIDPAVVIQRIEIDRGARAYRYLGPPESVRAR